MSAAAMRRGRSVSTPREGRHRRRVDARSRASEDDPDGEDDISDARGSDDGVRAVKAWLRENFFFAGVGAAACASASPEFRDVVESFGGAAGGSWGSGGLEKYAIAALFFIAGVGLPVRALKEAASDVSLNAFTQAFIFVFPTIVIAAAAPVLIESGWLSENVVDGLFVLACLPTTVGSGVAFTRSANGNVEAALLNSMAANLAGIFLTPALIHFYLGADSSVDPIASSSKLLVQAFLPVALGMSLRLIPGVASAAEGGLKEPSKLLGDAILLAIIAKTFVTAEQSEAGMLDFNSSAHLVSVLLVFMLLHKGSIFLAASRVGAFSREDVVCALYMGSHKTLAFGLPLISTTFEGDPNLASYVLPLVIYHPLQIFASSLLARPLARYEKRRE